MILAMDLGSTSFKAAVFDADLKRLSEGRAPLEHAYSPGGGVQLSTEEVERALAAAVSAALEQVDASALRAVSITSQAQTFTVLDAAGSPRVPFVSWQDTSPIEACAKLRDELPVEEFAEHCSFGQLMPALQLCQLRSVKGEVGPDERVVNLPTYFVVKLGGDLAVDDNLAAMSGLYSMRESEWWPAALSACGLGEEQLPRVEPIGSTAGVTGPGAEELGIPAGLPLVLAGNDQTAGAYGARVGEKPRVLLTLGTAHVAYSIADCELRIANSTSAPEAQSAICNLQSAIVKGPYPGDRRYVMLASGAGGNLVNWARELLGCGGDDEFFALAARGREGDGNPRLLMDTTSASASWQGLELGTTRADLARSVLASLADQAAAMVGAISHETPDVEVLAAGGGSRQALWLEMIGERLGTKLTAIDADALLGAALMAASAIKNQEQEG